MRPPPSSWVLGTRVDATSYDDATERILTWASAASSHYVCCANVHMVMEGHDDPTVRRAVNGASLVTSDGMPLVWWLRYEGFAQDRVYGPDLMLRVCAGAARSGTPVGLHGSDPSTLAALKRALIEVFPDLEIAHAEAPPFRDLNEAEVRDECTRISASGARVLFVGLGCPKQELWMARRRELLHGVQIGVGAAFDFISGGKRQAPRYIQQVGMEWAFRLAIEPRRLFKRYALHNTRFAAHAIARVVAGKIRGPR